MLVDWTSLNDTDPSNSFERTGAGCPAITAPNDYCSAPAVATITADARNSIVKTVIEDTYVEPPLSTAFDSIVRVGDTVTYQLDVNIQEGTTASVNILDSVPAGMTFVDVVSINGDTTPGYDPPASGPGSNFSYATIPAANVPAAGSVGPIFNWSLGNIANDAAGDPTTDALVIVYRARVTENILPHQNTLTLTNTADLTYIEFGNQNLPQLDNTATFPNDAGRARIYTSIEQNANVTMIPLLALPKLVTATSNTPLTGSPHDVSVGEELQYLLVADLPVANLRQFKIRDELPAGVRCIEGQVVNLSAPPYSAAGFVPGGSFTSTCTSTGLNDYVEWNFGDQAVTLGPPGSRFNFPITFIARVENSGCHYRGCNTHQRRRYGRYIIAAKPCILYRRCWCLLCK